MGKEQQELLEEAKNSIINFDSKKAEETAKKGLALGITPAEMINKGFVPGITEVGDLFDRGQLFLPELILAAEAMKAGTAICEVALLLIRLVR